MTDASLPLPVIPPPLPTLVGREIRPGDEAADLLPLGHLDHPDLAGATALEGFPDAGQARRMRDQRGEPQALRGEVAALLDHAGDEGFFPARTPELGRLTREIQRWRVACTPLA